MNVLLLSPTWKRGANAWPIYPCCNDRVLAPRFHAGCQVLTLSLSPGGTAERGRLRSVIHRRCVRAATARPLDRPVPARRYQRSGGGRRTGRSGGTVLAQPGQWSGGNPTSGGTVLRKQCSAATRIPRLHCVGPSHPLVNRRPTNQHYSARSARFACGTDFFPARRESLRSRVFSNRLESRSHMFGKTRTGVPLMVTELPASARSTLTGPTDALVARHAVALAETSALWAMNQPAPARCLRPSHPTRAYRRSAC